MADLDIHVLLPGASGRGYRFSETPVLVGRSEACQLIVRHAAMPRELCRIWLEDGGRRVRVEERPGLTNPLLHGGLPVRGGKSGSRLELAVGPVGLVAEPARYRATPGAARTRRGMLGGLGLAAVLIGLTWSLGSSPAGDGAALMPELPREPLPSGAGEGHATDGATDIPRAALLESRAADLLSRPDAGPAERAEALLALRRAAALLPGDLAATVEQRAGELEAALLASYREQVLALERSLAGGDRQAAARAAASLLAHLAHHADNPARERLMAIAGKNP